MLYVDGLPCFPPNLLFSFFYQVDQLFLPSIIFYFVYIFHNLARHLYSIYHSMAWLSKYTMGSWDQVSEMRKWCLGPPPHPLLPLLCSQWNWPDSAQDMAPAFFNQERNCWHVDTFLSKFWRWIRGRWGFLTLCIVPFSHHSYIVGCPTRPDQPACSRAANHPFLSEQAFRSGRREGQELGSVIRVCSLLTALLTHLRKDKKIS